MKLQVKSPQPEGITDWSALKQEIIAKLDIAAEYRALGVEFTRETPNGKDVLPCHALGRVDERPSAMVNVRTGIYHDSGTNTTLNFFDFALEHGTWGRWIDMFRYYAQKAGVEMGAVATGKGGQIREATYVYKTMDGRPSYAVFRYKLPNGKKRFSQAKANPSGGWLGGPGCMDSVELLPYRLDEIFRADPEEPIWILEGEKDCDGAAQLGLVASCNPMGAGKWRSEYNAYFQERVVFVVPDNDRAGHQHARHVATELKPVARAVKIVPLPGLPEKGDLSDWLDQGGTLDELGRLAYAAPEFEPARAQAEEENAPQVTVGDSGDGPDEPDVEDLWPRCDPLAFHGIAGEIVNLADPHNEGDLTATLVQFLVAFGNLIGHQAHFRVSATRHYLNLFATLVGPTGTGRKGTSLDIACFLLARIDEQWEAECQTEGLSSGEGLIHRVRDERYETRQVNGVKGQEPKKEKVLVDEGVSDKRLLVLETEFARVLKAMNKETNTLSAVLRKAFDKGDLNIVTRNAPVKARGAHISLIAHATREDIVRYLQDVDSDNGFANRFLWVASRQSKSLPDGGELDSVNWEPLTDRLHWAVSQARNVQRMNRNRAANELWRELYPQLNAPRSGLLGKILTRAAPITMRLACLYALLGGAREVGKVHLQAAAALWRYCEDSARYVFKDKLGNDDAEKLLTALKQQPGGLIRQQIRSDVFQRNKSSAVIATLLSELLTAGLIYRESDTSGGKRPAERWYAK